MTECILAKARRTGARKTGTAPSWTQEEIDALYEGHLSGESKPTLALRTGRTIKAIETKLTELKMEGWFGC